VGTLRWLVGSLQLRFCLWIKPLFTHWIKPLFTPLI